MGADDLGTMGARLRALREEAGLSRESLGERVAKRTGRDVGVRGQTIYRYETGEVAMMEADRAIAIAEEFGTDVRWLVEGDPPQAAAAAFSDFMQRIAPSVAPPMTLAERGVLVWTRFHQPSAERYLDALLKHREGRADDIARTATASAQSRADALNVRRIKPKRRT